MIDEWMPNADATAEMNTTNYKMKNPLSDRLIAPSSTAQPHLLSFCSSGSARHGSVLLLCVFFFVFQLIFIVVNMGKIVHQNKKERITKKKNVRTRLVHVKCAWFLNADQEKEKKTD